MSTYIFESFSDQDKLHLNKVFFVTLEDIENNSLLGSNADYILSELNFPNVSLINSEEDSIYLRVNSGCEEDLNDVVAGLSYILVSLKILEFKVKITHAY